MAALLVTPQRLEAVGLMIDGRPITPAEANQRIHSMRATGASPREIANYKTRTFAIRYGRST